MFFRITFLMVVCLPNADHMQHIFQATTHGPVETPGRIDALQLHGILNRDPANSSNVTLNTENCLYLTN